VIQTYNSRYLSIGGRHAKKCWTDRERGVETASFSQICDD